MSSVASLSQEYRDAVSAASFQGAHGYTVPLSALAPEDVRALKRELTIQPESGKFARGAAARPVLAYRISDKYMYLPMSFGFRRYGLPSASTIACSARIADHVQFTSEYPLRDEQQQILALYRDHFAKSFIEHAEQDEATGEITFLGREYLGDGGVIQVPCGAGKTVTVMAVFAAVRIPAFVVVPNCGLVTQWCEQFEKFLPGARVGVIRGKTMDAVDKDFVVCTIQTMYKLKSLPADIRRRFGMLVFDETHRMVSSEYSAVMFSVTAQYRMAVSATVDRKDGLSEMLDLFIGPTLYSRKRTGEGDELTVRKLAYSCRDPEFSRVETDERGEMVYATMLAKLAAYAPRTEFVRRVILGLVREFPETPEVRRRLAACAPAPVARRSAKQDGAEPDAPPRRARAKRKADAALGPSEYPGENQIIVFSVQKDLLWTLYEQLLGDGASVGLFMGDMAPADLAASARCQVMLATYSMAAEGLDIPTLSTMVMAQPRSEIEQVVGRILRKKGAKKPLVVDIVDQHRVFRAQFRKRCQFYDRCSYPVVSVSPAAHTTARLGDSVLEPVDDAEDEDESDDPDYSNADCCF